MEDTKGKNIIPDQKEGNQLDTHHEVSADSEAGSRDLFNMAASRLLNVNSWDKISGPVTSVFRLTDEHGTEISGPAKPGNYFKIDVPGPGPSSGEGYDWVRIEALEDERNPNAPEESVTMRVRPSPSPVNANPDTAHFFSETATSSFRVVRSGNVVRAEVHGRNEVPNTDVSGTPDKVRNAVMGTGAIAGMSAAQWKGLVNGLLDKDKDVA